MLTAVISIRYKTDEYDEYFPYVALKEDFTPTTVGFTVR